MARSSTSSISYNHIRGKLQSFERWITLQFWCLPPVQKAAHGDQKKPFVQKGELRAAAHLSDTWAPHWPSFKEVPSPPSWRFRGYFHPLFINLEGITLRSKLPALHKPRCEDSKYNFECSIWILTVKCNAHGFSQYYNFQDQKITMIENIGYITELTAWYCYQGHMSGTCVWRGGNRSQFFSNWRIVQNFRQ